MSLPRKSRPTFTVILPVSGEKVDYFPMRREDEKILLIAKSSAQKARSVVQQKAAMQGRDLTPQEETDIAKEQMKEILPAIKHTVEACITPACKDRISPLAMVDMEYLFIQIRMVSIDSTVPVTYHDNSDDLDYNFQVPLGDVKVQKSDIDPKIDLGDGLVLQMRYPPASLYEDGSFLDLNPEDQIDALIVACMDKVWDKDIMTAVDTVPHEEALAFINDMDRSTFNKVTDFLDSMPSLHYAMKYKNTKGEEREIVLSTLTDFFTFV